MSRVGLCGWRRIGRVGATAARVSKLYPTNPRIYSVQSFISSSARGHVGHWALYLSVPGSYLYSVPLVPSLPSLRPSMTSRSASGASTCCFSGLRRFQAAATAPSIIHPKLVPDDRLGVPRYVLFSQCPHHSLHMGPHARPTEPGPKEGSIDRTVAGVACLKKAAEWGASGPAIHTASRKQQVASRPRPHSRSAHPRQECWNASVS
jgi:hypothetical protein